MGIKAHNRPWVEAEGGFSRGQRIMEVGGAYSSLPRYLGEKYGAEAWIADDFGASSGEPLWSRWGDPKELQRKNPNVKYVFERFGNFSKSFPDAHFDRIFSVSTLEHIPPECRLDVLRDMNRCVKPGGKMLHAIDIRTRRVGQCLRHAAGDRFALLGSLLQGYRSEIREWIGLLRASGISIGVGAPNSIALLDRATLVETPDIVYRYYPPNNKPKPYRPNASLLLVIEDKAGA